MLKSFTFLLVFQLVGEVTVRAATLPVPGPVIGMVLLYGALCIRGSAPRAMVDTANSLLGQLSLLFVPAGVGIMTHFALIRAEWPAILLTLALSTLLTLLVTAYTMKWLTSRFRPEIFSGQ